MAHESDKWEDVNMYAEDEFERYVPISFVRERLLADGVESLAKLNYAKHALAMDYPEDWEGETEGHRNLWLDGAREQLRVALAAAFPDKEGE